MASEKQELAVEIYMANRGISKAEAMRRAGYAEATARNPKNLTATKSWQELMEEYFPDDAPAEKHKKRHKSSGHQSQKVMSLENS